MKSSQNQSNQSSGSSTFPGEAKEVLRASLLLSILKHTGGDHASKGEEHAWPEHVARASSLHARVHEPCRPDPQLVPRVKALIDSIGQCLGSFEKRVTKSDTSDQQNRLILIKEHVEEFVLPLLSTGGGPGDGVDVKTFSTQGKTYPMRFKIWGDKVYVLTSDWKVFVKESQLRVSDVLTVWAFSDVQTQGLCFVIACRRSKALDLSRMEKRFEAKDGSAAN